MLGSTGEDRFWSRYCDRLFSAVLRSYIIVRGGKLRRRVRLFWVDVCGFHSFIERGEQGEGVESSDVDNFE